MRLWLVVAYIATWIAVITAQLTPPHLEAPPPPDVERVPGYFVTQGDILLPDDTHNNNDNDGEEKNRGSRGMYPTGLHIHSYRKRWPDGKIPYTIANNVSQESELMKIIDDSVKHWNNYTCIKMTQWVDEPDYLVFVTGEGCYSLVGRAGGPQPVVLKPGFCHNRQVIHEIGHAVGLYHEQTRFDRDNYVNIQWENIKPGMESNFDRHDDELDLLAYDYNSIMHYRDTEFTKNGLYTIESPNVGEPTNVLSAGDIATVNFAYMNCEPTTSPPLCTHNKNGKYEVLPLGRNFTIEFDGFYREALTVNWEVTPPTGGDHGRLEVWPPPGVSSQPLEPVRAILRWSPEPSDVSAKPYPIRVSFEATDGAKVTCEFEVDIVETEAEQCQGRFPAPTDCSGHGTCKVGVLPCDCDDNYFGPHCQYVYECTDDYPVREDFTGWGHFRYTLGADRSLTFLGTNQSVSPPSSLVMTPKNGDATGRAYVLPSGIHVNYIAYWMYLEQPTGMASLWLLDASRTLIETIDVKERHVILDGYPANLTLDAHRWYHVEVKIDFRQRSIRLFLDGELKVGRINFPSDRASHPVVEVHLLSNVADTVTYIDDFYVDCKHPPTSTTTLSPTPTSPATRTGIPTQTSSETSTPTPVPTKLPTRTPSHTTTPTPLPLPPTSAPTPPPTPPTPVAPGTETATEAPGPSPATESATGLIAKVKSAIAKMTDTEKYMWGAVVGAALLLIICVCGYCCCKKKKQPQQQGSRGRGSRPLLSEDYGREMRSGHSMA